MARSLLAIRYRDHTLATTFAEVYRFRLWGRGTDGFYSGPGSEPLLAQHFVRVVAATVERTGARSVVDLGCGDFRVGRAIADLGVDYCGVDIVPSLIRRNAQRHGGSRVRFACRDITVDTLPAGDVGLLRQVLQHLSNAEIAAVLANCAGYRHLLVCEHVASAARCRAANLDRAHGPGTRVEQDSGVFVDASPFDAPGAERIDEHTMADGSRLVTTVISRPHRPLL